MNLFEMQNQNVDEILNELITHLIAVKKILENSDKELKMWRERYLRSVNISDDECEASYLSNIVRFTPVGIEDIDTYMEKCLISYRDTKK